MPLISCTHDEHAQAILDILNDAIVSSTALYDYVPRPLESMRTWFAAKQAEGFPVIGAVDGQGRLLGFASYGVWRAFPAYKYTVEHSLYVHRDHRGRGLGRALLGRLVERAIDQQFHVLVGAIDAANAGSLRLHAAMGFTPAGTIRQAGFKFGRWLDLVFVQRVLATPGQPVDG